MKRLLPLSLCTVVVAGAVLAGPVGARSARTITVVEHATTDVTTDTGKAGDSVGDILTFANDVFDAADKKKAGTDQGYCLRVVAGASYECNWTLLLPGGQIVVEGPFYDTKDSTLAITGGTGAYEGARGSMRLHALDGGKKYRFRYRLAG